MNNFFKRFVAFAIAAVMICGMLPVNAMAVETHDHSTHSDIQPFTSTEDLIEQVKAELAGQTHAEETTDQALIEAVESKSGSSYAQAETQLMMGFFNDRSGAEGQISTARLNLDEKTMTAFVESTLKAFNLNGIVEVSYVVENGVVTALNFSMRESFAAGLDEANGIVDAVLEAGSSLMAETVFAETVEEEEPAEKPFPFTDIPANHWARTAVNYLYQRGIVSGVSATKYGANVNVTRGQAVMMIWRGMNSPEPTGKNTFTDVKDSDYFKTAVVWAAENGIVSGTGNGKFSPNANITREQLIAIMYKLAQFNNMDVSTKADLKFKDAGKIASYAQEAVKWAIAAGLTSGYSDNTFRPRGTATRAEYAQVLYKFLLNAHDLVHMEATPSTCSVQGWIEHWACSKCGKLFADAKGKKELTKEEVYLPLDYYNHVPAYVPEVSPTCTASGVAAYYKCACGLVVDTNGNMVTNMDDLILAPIGHYPAADAETTVWNWERVVSYYYNTDENGNPTFNQGMKDAEGNPIPDFPLDANGNPIVSLYFDSTTGAVYASYQEIVTWECSSVEFVCAGCQKHFEADTTVSSYVMDQAWLEKTVAAYAEGIATDLITQYVTEKAMAYYAEHGSAPSDELTMQWVQEAQMDAALMGQVEMAANMKAMELAQNMDSTIFVASTGNTIKNAEGKIDNLVVQTNEVNATVDQLQRDWATMSAFNAYYSKYFGLVAPYWASKNTETSPFGAIIYMCSQEEQDLIPNAYMDMMISMLTQAFMSYVYSYADLLDAMIADAMAQVAYEELDEIDKLLLLHDWLAKYGTFDMQSLVDITEGTSTGNDPIAMTAFGVLLNDQIPKNGAAWDGGVCLGYAATYAMLVQQAFGKTQADAPMVDFVKIQFLTNVAESSVAAGDSGFGDGDAMFNSSHYLNAVKLSNGNWYYIDACYDDINTEVISQYRVETDGNTNHMSFLVAPSSWEEMFDGTYQYMDSLYDGKVWQRIFDGETGYYMMDKDGNVYTKAEADALKAEAEAKDEYIQLFYYYEAMETDAETRYEDATYEEAWFVSANSAINYDPETQYFYYTSGAINSYATMKDMFSDNGMGDLDDTLGDLDDSLGGVLGDAGIDLDMDMADMLEYKYDPAAQDKVVRRAVGAKNEPSSGNAFSMGTATDTEAEVLFHFGYGSVGAIANEQFQNDLDENSMTGDSTITDEEKGPYYSLVEQDQIYLSNYPELAHSTVMIDGKLYFPIGNAIYTFNFSAADMAKQKIDQITTLELVKVKEYDEITFSSNGKRFTGMSFEASESGTTLYYHPVGALSVHKDFKNNGAETLYVSIATNLTNSYKPDKADAYEVEAFNYNPDFYRFMEAEEAEDSGIDMSNTNTEFMWCANVVEKMPIEEMLSDLASGATETVSVAAYCGHDAFTEVRTTKFGLSTDGVKTVEEGTALYHEYSYNKDEETYICATCLEDHDHSYNYDGATIEIEWSAKSGTELTAEAYVLCNGHYCGTTAKADHVIVTNNGDGTFTAVATYGTLQATETMSLGQFLHPEHTYGAPEFVWTYMEATDSWSAKAVFSCTEGTDICHIEKDRKITVDCTITTDANGDYIANCTGPDGASYSSDPHHIYGEVSWTWTEVEGVMTATATKKCVNCAHTLTATAEIKETVTKRPDCYNEGEKVYDAFVTFADGFTAKGQKTVVMAKTSHEFNENGVCVHCGEINETHVHDYTGMTATYTWNEDYTSCIQSYPCATCDVEEGVTHTEATVINYSETTPATCTEPGIAVYVAVFADGQTTSVTVQLAALGHDMVDGSCTRCGAIDEN